VEKKEKGKYRKSEGTEGRNKKEERGKGKGMGEKKV